MSRPHRNEFEGALYHVTTRGNNRGSIFCDDADRVVLLSILGATIARTRWLCHAYCLMGNHYHLLLETPEPNLAAGMHRLNLCYAQRFNRRHGRCGHVFENRYHPVPIEREEHFLEVCRYVVLNPVRAGLCDDAGEWPWSSYSATAGTAPSPRFLTVDDVRAEFGDGERACERYREFIGAASPGPTSLEAILAGIPAQAY
jgi:putative transposase